MAATPLPDPCVAAVVLGCYTGTVGVLADVLRAGGVAVRTTAALDAAGGEEPRGVLRAAAALAGGDAVVVVTLGPGDPTLEVALAAVLPSRVVAVTWHPPDERPPLPAAVRTVEAGRIIATLAQVVRG